MFEKVNPEHPDKVADRIAGAIVDLAYQREENPKVAVEVLIGHGYCYIIIESSVAFSHDDIDPIVERITKGKVHTVRMLCNPQDPHLAANQDKEIRCGDNGIFKGVPLTLEQKLLTAIAASIYEAFPYDGKYLIKPFEPHLIPIQHLYTDEELKRMSIEDAIAAGQHMAQFNQQMRENVLRLTVCQSHANDEEDRDRIEEIVDAVWPDGKGCIFEDYNPLGEWTGGPDVDCGATNRKLGSDMGDGVTGGGLHGKDLSKADVSVNIVCFLKAVHTGQAVTATCSIGDESVTFRYADGKMETESFRDIVEQARLYILVDHKGSFEHFAEWGLIAPKAW